MIAVCLSCEIFQQAGHSQLALSPALQGAFHHAAHVGAHDGLHDLAGAFELLEEAVDLRERGAGTVGDSLAAASVDAIRMLTLVWGH